MRRATQHLLADFNVGRQSVRSYGCWARRLPWELLLLKVLHGDQKRRRELQPKLRRHSSEAGAIVKPLNLDGLDLVFIIDRLASWLISFIPTLQLIGSLIQPV